MTQALAYLFWHRRRPEVSQEDYEEALLGFHAALAHGRPAGFLGSVILQVGAIPWLGGHGGYADWYLVAGSAQLDTINRAAVSGACEFPHARVAALAADGIAGLYRMPLGERAFPAERVHEQWLSKPAGEHYPQFFARMRAVVGIDMCLWQRQMTLGPAPEFCLQAPGHRGGDRRAGAVTIDGRVLGRFGEL